MNAVRRVGSATIAFAIVALQALPVAMAALVLTISSATVVDDNDTLHFTPATVDANTVIVAYRDIGGDNTAKARVLTIDNDDSITAGGATEFNDVVTTGFSVAPLSATKFVVGYHDSSGSDDAEMKVGTITGTDIAFGNTITVNIDSDDGPEIVALSETKVFIAYRDHADTSGRGVIGTVSGNDISLGTVATFEENDAVVYGVATLTNDYVAIFYGDLSDSNKGHVVVADVSGATPSYGSAVEVTTGAALFTSITAVDSDTFVIAFRDFGSGNNGKIRVINVSGTTISAGSAIVFDVDTVQYTALTNLDDSTIILSYQDAGSSVAIVGTVDGTSVTFGDSLNFYSSPTYIGLTTLSSEKALIGYQESGRGLAHILTYAEEVIPAAQTGSAWRHRQIRDRYAEIAAGLHSSAEDRTDTEPPSLRDVGIFRSASATGTGSAATPPLSPALLRSGTAIDTETQARIDRLHRRIASLAQPKPESRSSGLPGSLFRERVCTRVLNRFTGNALGRVNMRLERRFGWVCRD